MPSSALRARPQQRPAYPRNGEYWGRGPASPRGGRAYVPSSALRARPQQRPGCGPNTEGLLTGLARLRLEQHQSIQAGTGLPNAAKTRCGPNTEGLLTGLARLRLEQHQSIQAGTGLPNAAAGLHLGCRLLTASPKRPISAAVMPPFEAWFERAGACRWPAPGVPAAHGESEAPDICCCDATF